MSDTHFGPIAPAPRGRSILLIVSLCVNVALIVMILAGVVMMIRHAPPPRGNFSPQALMDAASPAERPKMQAIFDAHEPKVKELRKADGDARKAVFEAFQSANLDSAALQQALDNVRVADDALRSEQTKAFVEAIRQLAPAERETLAAKAKRRLMWWHYLRTHFLGQKKPTGQ